MSPVSPETVRLMVRFLVLGVANDAVIVAVPPSVT